MGRHLEDGVICGNGIDSSISSAPKRSCSTMQTSQHEYLGSHLYNRST